MIKRILYATDLGLYSPYVMKKLRDFAIGTPSEVDILHVIEPMGVFAESVLKSYITEEERRYLHQYGFDRLLVNIKKQVSEALESEYQGVFNGLRINDVMVEQGNPAQLIIEKGLEINANLLVLGSHCQYSPENNVLGSVVSKVMHTSPLPVLVIPMVDMEGIDRRD